MEEHKRWKIKFSILMVILIIIIYGSNYLVLGDAEHIISYIWTHLGFIPVDILVVAFLLDEIIERKEKEAMLEKLDMLMSTFFSEVGNELISQLSSVNKYNTNTEDLKSIKNWDEKVRERIINQIVQKYQDEYLDTNADGIYFQSFTELQTAYIGDKLIAETVVDFVNYTAGMLLEKYPHLHIQFGLHADSVKNHTQFIAKVDPSVE